MNAGHRVDPPGQECRGRRDWRPRPRPGLLRTNTRVAAPLKRITLRLWYGASCQRSIVRFSLTSFAARGAYGTEAAQAARELSVPDERITTIAAQLDGITPANGANAAPGALEEIARLVAAGQLRVPIAATFPVEQIRAAVELQAGRHVHGKVVIDL
jgi:NADPH:quinone reductase-like Zn-dependent oxidoreductase